MSEHKLAFIDPDNVTMLPLKGSHPHWKNFYSEVFFEPAMDCKKGCDVLERLAKLYFCK